MIIILTLHQSTISDFEMCPHLCLRLWGRYGDPDPDFRESDDVTNKYASCGTALHTVMDEWAKAVKGGATYTLDQGKERVVSLIEEIPIDLFETELDKQEWKDKMVDQLEWIWGIYCTAPPLYSELNFHLEDLIPGLPPIEGTIDRIDGSLKFKKITMFDYKTGKQYTKKELLSNVQATLYSLAFERMFGFRPSEFIFIFSKTKREKRIFITQDFIDRGLERIKSVWYRIEQDDFAIPNKVKSKFFCEHFCPVYSECPKWSKRKPEGWEGIDRLY